MKALNYSFFSFLLLFLVSCDGENVMNEVSGSYKVISNVLITIPQIEDEGASTRTEWYMNNGTPDFRFMSEDTVGIFPTVGDQVNFPLTKATGKSFTFDGGGWGLRDNAGYGFYIPFSKANYFKDNKSILLNYEGQEQTGDNSISHLGAFDYLACGIRYAENNQLNITMERQCCVLWYYITIPIPETYVSAIISASEEDAFIVEDVLDISGTSPVLTPNKKADKIVLGLKDLKTTTDFQTVRLYMMSAPTDLTGKTLNITLRTSSGMDYTGVLAAYGSTANISKPYNWAANRNRYYHSILSSEGTPSPGESEESQEGTSATNPNPGEWN